MSHFLMIHCVHVYGTQWTQNSFDIINDAEVLEVEVKLLCFKMKLEGKQTEIGLVKITLLAEIELAMKQHFIF